MARARLVFGPRDLPDNADQAAHTALAGFFDRMEPVFGRREIPPTAAGFGIVARTPRLALMLADIAGFMTRECAWTAQRGDLRELSVQAINLHFRCDYNFQSHLAKAAQIHRLPVEVQAAIPLWQTSTIFDDEQRLVLECTFAALKGTMTDELFARATAQFGEDGAVEMVLGIAWWSYWAILVGAIGPVHDFGYGAGGAAP